MTFREALDKHLQAIQHRDPEESDKADAGRDRKGDAPKPKGDDPADDREGDVEENQRCRAERTEGEPEQEHDEMQPTPAAGGHAACSPRSAPHAAHGR